MSRPEKTRGAKPKAKKLDVSPLDTTATGDDRIAYELINLFASAMRALNGNGLPIPVNWENHLTSLLVPPKSRRRGKASIRVRKTALAKDVIKAKMTADKLGQRSALKTILAAPDSKNIHREVTPVWGDAKLEILNENKQKRIDEEHAVVSNEITSIKKRLQSGEDLLDIYREEFSDKTKRELRRLLIDEEPLTIPRKEIVLSERDKAYRWMSDGLNLHFNPVHRDFSISLEYPEDIAVVATAIKGKATH